MRLRFTYIVVFCLLVGFADNLLPTGFGGSPGKTCELRCPDCFVKQFADAASLEKTRKPARAETVEKTIVNPAICVADRELGVSCYLRQDAFATGSVPEASRRSRPPK